MGDRLVLLSGMIRCRVARRASWVASGLGRRARAALSCVWSMTRGSVAVTGIVCLGLVAGFGAGIGSVGELWSLCGVRPSSFVESSGPVLVEAGVAAGALVLAVA